MLGIIWNLQGVSMATLAEILQVMEGERKAQFGESSMKVTKTGADDLRALREAEIAQQEEAAARKKEIANANKRASGVRAFMQVANFLTGSQIGSVISKPVQSYAKDHRFTLSSPLGEKVKDPYRDVETETPDTTFYGTSAEKLKSRNRTFKDLLGDAEKSYDQRATVGAITDAFTSYQTQAAGFTPEYLGDIFKDIGSGTNIFEAIKAGEASRRKATIADIAGKTIGNRNVGASSIQNIQPNFGRISDPLNYGKIPFKLGDVGGEYGPETSLARLFQLMK